MNFALYSDVILLKDIVEDGLFAGDIGTVVDIHNVSGLETGYSVEFFDLLGNTRSVVTLPMSYFRQPTKSDIPTVRLLSEVA
ncbi:hypothetical protein GM3708_1036 [Geminocystis sp. NIES-3708]|uniref:DUF4926 domain-containing protein n=1 Tax=Geminocystis sp. NIES-3708 TaxID=1615909 RepID=UPI0005FCD56F|nr:DUF4926 domain-containing protein [Geminocystis sp. NIES-3708]BAQ60630.1 hypothetical protein GM3708_1036 [Geminocystis sp. NIES-3708]